MFRIEGKNCLIDGKNHGLSKNYKRLNPDVARRNNLRWQAQMEISKLRKEAAAEYNAFMKAWSAKWRHISHPRSANQKRRNVFLRQTRLSGDKSLLIQINLIKIGPCKCFWCEALLPAGGTVDHIIPLSKGGCHTSDNICAACKTCNTIKSNRHHSAVSKNNALL